MTNPSRVNGLPSQFRRLQERSRPLPKGLRAYVQRSEQTVAMDEYEHSLSSTIFTNYDSDSHAVETVDTDMPYDEDLHNHISNFLDTAGRPNVDEGSQDRWSLVLEELNTTASGLHLVIQAEHTKVVAANNQAADARAALTSLHGSIQKHSQKALIATAHLERIGTLMCDAYGLKPHILSRIQQLKDSLSHLLIMGIDDVIIS